MTSSVVRFCSLLNTANYYLEVCISMGKNDDFTNGKKFRSRAVTFKGGKNSIGDTGQLFIDPQLIIIEDETELAAFNKVVSCIADDWRENISELKNLGQFPIYIVEMDMITCGIRYGEWRVFYDKDKLQEFIDY